eukprot:PhM_4_TR11636/c8_g1_i2/m.6174
MAARETPLKALRKSTLKSTSPSRRAAWAAALTRASAPHETATPTCPRARKKLRALACVAAQRSLPAILRIASPHAIGRMPPPFLAMPTSRAPNIHLRTVSGTLPLARHATTPARALETRSGSPEDVSSARCRGERREMPADEPRGNARSVRRSFAAVTLKERYAGGVCRESSGASCGCSCRRRSVFVLEPGRHGDINRDDMALRYIPCWARASQRSRCRWDGPSGIDAAPRSCAAAIGMPDSDAGAWLSVELAGGAARSASSHRSTYWCERHSMQRRDTVSATRSASASPACTERMSRGNRSSSPQASGDPA